MAICVKMWDGGAVGHRTLLASTVTLVGRALQRLLPAGELEAKQLFTQDEQGRGWARGGVVRRGGAERGRRAFGYASAARRIQC